MIEKLNAAGLEYLQISIDNITPDEVSQKSLKVLDRYLRYLSERRISRKHQFGDRRDQKS